MYLVIKQVLLPTKNRNQGEGRIRGYPPSLPLLCVPVRLLLPLITTFATRPKHGLGSHGAYDTSFQRLGEHADGVESFLIATSLQRCELDQAGCDALDTLRTLLFVVREADEALHK